MKRRTLRALAAGSLCALALAAPSSAQQGIPEHPSELVFPELDFQPPDPAGLRHVLANGVVAYVVEDHQLPLVSVSLLIRTGEYAGAARDWPGLAMLTGSQMRNGGTASMTPEQFDEELDFLAAQMGSGIGDTSGNADMNCLTKDLDRCLELFFEMVREPRYDAERLELANEILAKLEAQMADWPVGEPAGEIPPPTHVPEPGLYLVDKPDVNQGRVSIGHLGTTQDNPDRYAIMVMNHILGGGAFTSRVTSRVRSDEGLAYTAACLYSFGTWWDGAFRCFFQSRSEAVARATSIVLEEIERIRSDKVSEEEIATAKPAFIETFSRNFASAAQTARLFANLELQGRDPEFLEHYRDDIAAVTADDVLRVAREYLHPDQLVILAVGNLEAILAGDPDHPDYSLEALAPGGHVERIPLPDPMTMEYPGGS